METSSADPLEVAVIGLGSIGQRHAALAVAQGAAVRAQGFRALEVVDVAGLSATEGRRVSLSL